MPHPKIVNGTWVLIGDGQRALFLINEGDEELLNLRRLSVEERENPPAREQGTDAPGRAFSSVGARRSSVENTDWHQLEEERFAVAMAEQINKAAHAGAFDHIVIVAPPKILGDLRREFSKTTEAKILAELNKDLTHHQIDEIEKILLAAE
jgi:protein required for attachment to host cells